MRISDWSSDVCSSDLGTLSSLASELSQPELEAAAGNGGNEIRAWLMLAAAMNDAPRSEEHTSELQSLMRISYAVFCLKKKKNIRTKENTTYQNKHQK